MLERIRILAEKTMNREMGLKPVSTEYDREDFFLSPVQRSAKRVREYILHQEPLITKYQTMTGLFNFDGSVEGDHFNRQGFQYESIALKYFYCKPLNNLVTLEWQHSVADFNKIITRGVEGVLEDIDKSLAVHEKPEEVDFLNGVRTVALTLCDWAHKCAERARSFAETVEEEEYKANLLRMADTLEYIPRKPARTYYEAVLSLYITFPLDPDSIGTIDRYFEPFYEKEKAAGSLNDEEARSCLQELFLMQQAWNTYNVNFTRGGQSHFCVGGYRPDGSDGCTAFSLLVIDALMELPSCIPQISLRWTAKTPFEKFRYVLKKAVEDPMMRIAFVNDEPRIRGFMDIVGLSYEDAVSYCMCGCNEPALPGGMIMGAAQENIARFIENTFYKRREDILACADYEAFYAIAKEEMYRDLGEMLYYDRAMNQLRARDVDLVSSMLFRGCIENARSMTQGGCDYTTAMLDMIGFTTVIDSLSVTKQFVFDEKRCSMRELCGALDADWEGYEELHTLIANKGRFFGNNEEESDSIAKRLYNDIYEFLADKTDWCGKHYLIGDLIGYQEHNVWFGQGMKATPDGRYAGERISFGRGQSDNRDRCGLSALLNSVAACDEHHVVCGPTVTNLMLDPQMVKNAANFEKVARMLEIYFKNGGIHFQLSYTDRQTLQEAQRQPDLHRTLRVRVSGFSDYFNNLKEGLQNEIIDRTQQSESGD